MQSTEGTHLETVFAFASSGVDLEWFPTQYHVKLCFGTLLVARTREEPPVLEIYSRAQSICRSKRKKSDLRA